MYVLTNEKYTCDSGTLPESGVKIYDTEKGMSIHVNISEKQALAPFGLLFKPLFSGPAS